MFQTTNSLEANKLLFTDDSIDKFDDRKIIMEATGKKSEIKFLTTGAKLAFLDLRQAFRRAPILHHWDLKYSIWI